MGWEPFGVVRFDIGDLLQGQMRIAKLKCAYNLPIIVPGVLGCDRDLQQIMGWESSNVVRLDLGQLLQGQMRIATFKSAYNSLVIALVVGDMKATYGKSWAGSLLMWSD